MPRSRARDDLDARLERALDQFYLQQAEYLEAHDFKDDHDVVGVTLRKMEVAAASLEARIAGSTGDADPMKDFQRFYEDQEDAREGEAVALGDEAEEPVPAPAGVAATGGGDPPDAA